MQYLHVKNLEKYHPNYKDRNLIWCKVYFSMMNGDPKFELLCEIDQWRFVKFIMLEIQAQEPVPVELAYLSRKGFDLKKRPISLTLQMLHNFIELRDETVTQSREEVEKEEEKATRARGSIFQKPTLEELKAIFGGKGFPAEAEKFFDYYESNGWRVGRNPMKSVTSAVANWIRNGQSFGKLTPPPLKKEKKLVPNPECPFCQGSGYGKNKVKCPWCWK